CLPSPDTAATSLSPLSLHAALPTSVATLIAALPGCPHARLPATRATVTFPDSPAASGSVGSKIAIAWPSVRYPDRRPRDRNLGPDRKSTRLNSSHRTISYAVFCLKK